jgi:sec-independent protein translocase protein TatC
VVADGEGARRRNARRRRRPSNPHGAMTLFQHLKEFQVRLFRSVLGICAGCIVGWIFYDQIVDLVRAPFDEVVEEAKSDGQNIVLAINGVTEAFSFQLKIVLVSGVVIALPISLYQLWRFLAPGLQGMEKRWAYGFVIAATPLFLFGVFVAYETMPQLLAVFLGFTPENVSNIININDYLSFTLQILLFFGIGMLVPVVFLMLNFAGLLSARALVRHWRWLLIGCLTFAAVATPTPDPVTMLLVATPFLGVVTVAVAITALNDVRRMRRRGRTEVDDDLASPIGPVEIDPDDLRPSPLDASSTPVLPESG